MRTQYFPQNSFHKDLEMDIFTQNWYASHLDVLDGVNIQIKSSMNAVRFTCLRTFHKPFMIKASWNKDKAKLEFRMSSGAGGYEPGKLIIDRIKIITRQDIVLIVNLLIKYDFFNQPETMDELGCDGSQWIIEANIKGKYKVADRWSPENGVNFEIGNTLIKMSGEKIDELY